MKLLFALITFLLTGSYAQSQTCTTGQGDPIVNITFGSGTGFGPPLATGITNMTYQSSGCVLDNAYEIVNQVSGCYTGDWVTVPRDHTGDPNGYLMLIGASDIPSTFYLQKVNGLCGSTQYQFAAWVLNLASHSGEIQPNISFSIEKTDGTVLGSSTTGNIPISSTAVWNQYGFDFTTPAGVNTVMLRMTNNAPGGYGNDLCLDDITFRTIGPKVTTSIDGHTGDTVTMCSGGALQFSSTVESCYASTSYQWEKSIDNGASWSNIPGAVNSTYNASLSSAGAYLYRLTVAGNGNIGNNSCEVVSSIDTITVLQTVSPGIAISGPDQLCAGDPANFTATATNGGTTPQYQWMLNGTPVGSSMPSYTDNAPNNGDQISCILINYDQCVVNPTTTSNLLSLEVLPIVNHTVSIAASTNNVCGDTLITFTATPDGTGPVSYQWTVNGNPVNDTTITFASRNLRNGDIVAATVAGTSGCSAPGYSNAISMTIYEVPTVWLPADTMIAAHTSIRLSPVVTGPVQSFQWTPAIGLSDPAVSNPVASPLTNTIYSLLVTTPEGCKAFAKEEVDVFYGLSMPSAFTPNGDGVNDIFRVPPSIPTTVQKFLIFNRWGQEVFSATGREGWNGRLNGQDASTGTYVWMIEYYDPITKRKVRMKGTVELVR